MALRPGTLLAVLLLAAVSGIPLPIAARADDATDRRAVAAEVLEQMRSAEMVANLVPSIIGQIKINLTHNDPTLVKQFDDYASHLQATAEASKPDLIDKLVDVYARTFTADELRDMLAYYKSPVGQRIIATQGQINRDMLAVARDWGNGVATVMAKDAATELQGTKAP